MQVSVETTSGLERRLTAGVPAEKLDSAVDARLQDARKNLRLPGFRPGKVPMIEVKRRFAAAMRAEAAEELMREQFIKAIQEQNIEPAGLPRFEPTVNEAGKDLEFVATFEVYPEVTLAGFDSIQVVRPHAEIGDADIDKMIENLREQRSLFKEKDGAAADGDRVNIDFAGSLNGEAFEGGTAKGQQLVLGSGQMIPGFEDGIVGMKAGDTKTIDVTFPEDYQAENLKGQAAQFEITVNKVEAKTLPDVDAEFMKLFGIEDGNMDGLRAEVRKNMERELKNAVKGKVKEQAMASLVKQHEFDVPNALVNGEIQRMRQQMMQQFGGQAGNFDPSMLPAELFTEQAQRSVRLGLIVRRIIEQNDVKLDEARVRTQVEEIASQYEQPQELIDWVYGNKQQLQQIEAAVLEDQVIDLILAAAKVEERAMSYEDAVRPAARDEGDDADEA
ncbi:trigger factor [Isoalcanivorax beigongshangi]|uniref:Trigger factor n=1 Tax=Isoalcanivorax beigongshangi TaxID=3238810 RepID=A0ABV4AGW4_9GAMM